MHAHSYSCCGKIFHLQVRHVQSVILYRHMICNSDHADEDHACALVLHAVAKYSTSKFVTCSLSYATPDQDPPHNPAFPQYYPLDISFFKSSTDAHMLDLLWYKYWVATLSASPLISNREFAAGQVRGVILVCLLCGAVLVPFVSLLCTNCLKCAVKTHPEFFSFVVM